MDIAQSARLAAARIESSKISNRILQNIKSMRIVSAGGAAGEAAANPLKHAA